MSTLSPQNKFISEFIHSINRAIARKEDVRRVLETYCAEDIVCNLFYPYNTVKGINEWYDTYWHDMISSFPDIEDQPYLLMSDHTGDSHWVGATGNYIANYSGTSWLGMPVTKQLTYLRYGTFYEVIDNKITKVNSLVDTIDFVKQCDKLPSYFSFIGSDITIPAPLTGDGIVKSTDINEAKDTLALVDLMIDNLLKYDGTLESMSEHKKTWHPQMMWYGPTPIGSNRSMNGFEDRHQIPFLEAFPDRVGGNHYARFAQGNYCASGGWPSIHATYSGSEWFGLKNVSETKVTMRVMDFWRKEDGLLRENWVFIDMLDLLSQLGINVIPKHTK